MIEIVRAARRVARPLKDPGGEPLDQRKQLVCGKSLVRDVMAWGKRQPDWSPGFSEAVRYLIARGIRADDEDKRRG